MWTGLLSYCHLYSILTDSLASSKPMFANYEEEGWLNFREPMGWPEGGKQEHNQGSSGQEKKKQNVENSSGPFK